MPHRQDKGASETLRDLRRVNAPARVRAGAALVADVGVGEGRLGVEDVIHAEAHGHVAEVAAAFAGDGVGDVRVVRDRRVVLLRVVPQPRRL